MTLSENDNALVEKLLESIQGTTSLIQSFMSEIKDNATALATLEVKLESLSDNAKVLSKIVRDDNGNKSILTRVAILENELNDLAANYKEFKTNIYKKSEDAKNDIVKISAHLKESNTPQIKKDIQKLKERTEEKESFGRQKIINILQIAPGVISLVIILVKIFWGIGE